MTLYRSPSTLHFSCARSSHRVVVALAQYEQLGLCFTAVPRLSVRRKCHLLQQFLNPSGAKPALTRLSRLPDVTPESSAELNTS